MSRVGGRTVAGLLLVGFVALASTSRLEGGARLESSPAGYVALGLAAGVVLMVLVFWLTLGGFAARVEMRRSTRLMLLGTVGALVLAVGAILFAPPYHAEAGRPFNCSLPPSYYKVHHIDFAKLCPPSVTFAGHKIRASGGGDEGNKTAAILLAAGASLLTLLVIGTAVVMAVRRRRAMTPAVVEGDMAVLQALDESLDDLRRERDVRRAIVACYARMERALAGAGSGRRAHETPLEFLARVLERVAREPGQVLTGLFERARFSIEPMGESDKQRAIAALEQLRARVVG